MPEYLMTDAGERVEIPAAVVGQSDNRDLVKQYVAGSPSERTRIAAAAQKDADAQAEARKKQIVDEMTARDAIIAAHQDLVAGRITAEEHAAVLKDPLKPRAAVPVASPSAPPKGKE